MSSPWYLPARPPFILPPARELEIPRRTPLERARRRPLERAPMLALPTLVQTSQSAYAGGPNVQTTLGAALTPGNVLVAISTKADNAGFGGRTVYVSGSGAAMSSLGNCQAHTNGGTAQLHYRVIQPGDGNTIYYPVDGGNIGIGAAEFTGLTGNLGPSASMPTNSGGPVMGIPIAPASVAWLVVAIFATRADTPPPGAGFAPNADSTALALAGVIHNGSGGDYDNGAWCYGFGAITIGGTQTGPSRNGGAPWAGIAQAFEPALSVAFVGEPGGGVW